MFIQLSKGSSVKRIATFFLTVAVTTGGPMVVAAPAEATAGCATYAEFKALEFTYTTYERVGLVEKTVSHARPLSYADKRFHQKATFAHRISRRWGKDGRVYSYAVCGSAKRIYVSVWNTPDKQIKKKSWGKDIVKG